MTLQAIRWSKVDGKLEILDQTLLPADTRYIQVKGVEDGWKVINKMQVGLSLSATNVFFNDKLPDMISCVCE